MTSEHVTFTQSWGNHAGTTSPTFAVRSSVRRSSHLTSTNIEEGIQHVDLEHP